MVKTKVFAFGVFDYFHYGHLKLLERAKKLGDYLIIAVQESEEITKNKPDAKVMYTTEQRVEMIGAIKYVDEVITYKQIEDDIKKVDFDIFVVGGDQNHAGIQRAIKWAEDKGKKIVTLSRTPNICSSDIKKTLLK